MLENYLLQFYFKITSRGQKHGGFFLNCAKILKIVLSWLWVDFKMKSVLGYSRKNPNRKMGKKTPRGFRFVTLTLKIAEKMELYHWKFYKIVLHPLEFQAKNQNPWRFHIIFSGSPFEIPLLFLLIPGISIYSFNKFGNFMSLTSPVWIFSGIGHWKSGEKRNKFIYIYIYIYKYI